MSTSAQAGSEGSPASANKTKDLFNAALQSRNPNNAYIAHLKIWEEVEGAPAPDNAAAAGATKKARYLILAVQKDTGRVTINKAKRNANGSFSIGKDWDLNTLRQVHVIQPDVFSITLSRSYQWQTQQPIEQQLFLQSLVKVYRKYTQDDGPRLVGIDVPLSSGSAAPTVAESANLSDHPSSGYRTDTSQAVSSNGTAIAAAAAPTIAAPAINTTAPLRIQRESGASPTRSLPSDGGSANGRDRSGSQSSSTQQSPTKSKREGGIQPSPLSRNIQLPSRPSADSQRSALSESSTAPPRPTLTASNLAVPRQAPPRKNSADSVSIRSGSSGGFSAGGGGGGGDARARLSSIEPIRGGAAYERMLLAGTGLTGVTEVDDDEAGDADQDPYGGAVLADKDAGPDASFSSKRATLGRPAIARLETDKTKLSERSRPPADDADEDEDENSTLVAVEEMLEGLEWRNASAKGYGVASGKGTADMIEARLLDELSALEAANIFAIIESDDRVALVVKHMEEALADLDMMDSMIAGFKVQLNARADDISHIESQNRGLQVQTSNQRTLMAEIETLINTINVDEGAIHSLSAGRLESSEGVSQLEVAAASLYKSMLQARRDGDGGGADMAAAAERLADHEAISARFCKRVLDYLNVTFSAETQRLLSDPSRQKALQPPHPSLPDHASMEEVLGQYCGLLLYMKEVSSATFSRVSAAYFASASECYRTEMQQLFAAYRRQLRKASDEDVSESSFVGPTSTGVATAAMRSGTIRRAQRDKSIKGARDRGDVAGQDGLQRILSCIFPVLLREQNFISDFLHINDNNITFADYMDLEPYFRRRAAGMFASISATGPLREMKGAMDLIFGFVAPELQSFTDDALAKDKMCIVGLLATLDRGIIEAEEVNCELLQKVLAKLHLRLASQLERFVQEQIKGIEATKLTVKKRKGVVHFMRVFPVFVDRVEQQLVNAETLNIRHAVDGYYVQICGTMFEALQTISRVESAVDDDKGQLNHLVILIENMWYFISEINKLSSRSTIPSASLAGLVKRAQSIYDDSLTSYTGFVLRRSLAKMMDFADGIDALLKNTPATEVSLHSAYSKGAFKKMCKDHTAKDTRKAVEALSKRVGKHFDDDEIAATGSTSVSSAGGDGTAGAGEQEAEVLGRVWGSCEHGYLREFQRVARIGKECYPDVSGASLELGANELRRLFASLAPKRR